MSASRRRSIGVVFQAAFIYRIRLSENGICALWLALSVVFTFAPNRGAATYFLCFAKESKQRKATPTCRSASQTSLTAHPFFGACELAALCASSDKRTLFPEKRMLRSAGRRGVAAALNICEALGSLKANPFSTKPFGSTLNGFVFQAAFGFARFSGCLIYQFFQFVHQI